MTRRDGMAPLPRHARVMARARVASAAAILLVAVAQSARADVQVQGDADQVRIAAHDATIAQVLAALGPAYNVRYRSAIPLDEAVSGTFSGPLGRVIARVLEGYSYTVARKQDALEVVVIGKRGVREVPAASPAPPRPPSLTQQWRSPLGPAPAQKP
jgi:hypothetical protein